MKKILFLLLLSLHYLNTTSQIIECRSLEFDGPKKLASTYIVTAAQGIILYGDPLREQDIIATIPHNAEILICPCHCVPDFLKAWWNGQEGFIKEANIRTKNEQKSVQIEEPEMYLAWPSDFKRFAGQEMYGIFPSTEDQMLVQKISSKQLADAEKAPLWVFIDPDFDIRDGMLLSNIDKEFKPYEMMETQQGNGLEAYGNYLEGDQNSTRPPVHIDSLELVYAIVGENQTMQRELLVNIDYRISATFDELKVNTIGDLDSDGLEDIFVSVGSNRGWDFVLFLTKGAPAGKRFKTVRGGKVFAYY